MTSQTTRARRASLVAPVLEFLACPTPAAWVAAAAEDMRTLLLDHASLELKAAQQAQTLIWRYGIGDALTRPARGHGEPRLRLDLLRKLSRLAREELRHFEQVVEWLAARGIPYEPVSASRYARELHARIRAAEPDRCVDTLIVGAVIEARSCERFYALLPMLERSDAALGTFYASLLRSEARHFEDYLALARRVAVVELEARIGEFLDLDAELITQPDPETRFHSGPPARGAGRAHGTV